MALDHAAAGEKIHIPSLESLPAEAKTSALVKTDRFEAVQLVMRAGSTIAPHAVDGPIILHCLEGRAILEVDGAVELGAGDWVHLEPGARHGLSAIEDSSLLLTIIFGKG